MKIFKTLSKRGLALFLALTMCMSLLPATALAAEVENYTAQHNHNQDGWNCELICGFAEEHTHTDACYEQLVQNPVSEDLENQVPADPALQAPETAEPSAPAAEENLPAEESIPANGARSFVGGTIERAIEGIKNLFATDEPSTPCGKTAHTHTSDCWSCTYLPQAFLNAVNAIPAVVTVEDEAAVVNARAAYTELREDVKSVQAVVDAYAVLTDAEAALEKAKNQTPAEPVPPVEPEVPQVTVIPEGATVITPDRLLAAAQGRSMSMESFFGLVQSSKIAGDNPPATLTFVGEGVNEEVKYEDAASRMELVTVNAEGIQFNGALVTVYAQGVVQGVDGANTMAISESTELEISRKHTLEGGGFGKSNHNWSSDSSVVKVTPGIVKCNGYVSSAVPGTATITHTYSSGNKNYTDTWKITFYADIRFDLNGGQGTKPSNIRLKDAPSIILPAGDGFSRPGYTFIGWSTTKDPQYITDSTKSPIYSPGSEFIPEKSVTLYAVWAKTEGEADNLGLYVSLYTKDGELPDEPQVHDTKDYRSLYANNSADALQYLNPLRLAIGVEAVESCLTDTFYSSVTKWNQEIRLYDEQTEYVEWYVIKRHSDGWHIDGTVRKKDKVNLDYRVAPGVNYAGLLPTGKQYFKNDVAEVSGADITRQGYVFDSWNTRADGTGTRYMPGTQITMTENVILYAQWRASNATPYKVEHYRQIPGTTNYELVDTENLSGKTDSPATAVAKSYPGFSENTAHSERVPSGTITADGGLTLKLYYDVNENDTKDLTYTVQYYKDSDAAPVETKNETLSVWAGTDSGTVDLSTVAPADKFPGYKLTNTPTNPGAVEDKITVQNGTVIKVYYVADTAAYTVNYYYESPATGEYLSTPSKTETKSGTIGTPMEYITEPGKVGHPLPVLENKEYILDVYATNSTNEGKIAADGSGVVNVYFALIDNSQGSTDPTPDRYKVTVTFKVSNGKWNNGETENIVKTVVLRGTDGKPSLDGSATVTAPEVGNNPDDGYKSGYVAANWGANVPVATVTKADNGKTYTYTYQAKPVLTLEAAGYTGTYDGDAHGITVTAKDANGTAVDIPNTAIAYYSDAACTATISNSFTNVTAGTTVYAKVTMDEYTIRDNGIISASVVINQKKLTVDVNVTDRAYNGK